MGQEVKLEKKKEKLFDFKFGDSSDAKWFFPDFERFCISMVLVVMGLSLRCVTEY